MKSSPQDIAKASLILEPTDIHNEIQTLHRLVSRAIKKDMALFLFVQYQKIVDAQNIIDLLQQKADTGIKLVPVNCQEQNIQFLSPYLLQEQDVKKVFCILNLPRRQDSQGEKIDPGFLFNLNFTRDQLQEHKIKTIFFLTEHELSAVVRKADDFWAFRHRLLKLPVEIGRFVDSWSRPEVSFRGSGKEEIQRQIGYRKSLLDTVSSPEKKVSLINEIAQRYILLGQYQKALNLLEDGLKISKEIGDKSGEGTILNNISQIYRARGDYETALDYLSRSLKICQEIGDKSGEGTTLSNIGSISYARGKYETAFDYLSRSLKISQEIGDRAGEAVTSYNITRIYEGLGKIQPAIHLMEHVVEIDRQIGLPNYENDLAYLNRLIKMETATIYSGKDSKKRI
ncbi:MAG: tetratricopeptide repeat protein [bacterium]|nr:tetratricopeptide repeat protein [bacterium]